MSNVGMYHRREKYKIILSIQSIIPIIPFVLAFDGVVSILRTYTTEELADMAAQAGTDGYRWQVRQTTNRGLGRMTCLIGWPAAEGGVEIVPYPT